jgi:hypothetical protein
LLNFCGGFHAFFAADPVHVANAGLGFGMGLIFGFTVGTL